MNKTNKRTRSAVTGRFMQDGSETRLPRRTIREVIDSPKSRAGKVARKVVRDAITGQFLPSEMANNSPDTTIVQTIYYTIPRLRRRLT